MILSGLITGLMIGMMSVLAAGQAAYADETITLQSTTSTHNSGLYEVILPQYTATTGDHVRVVSVGTGQAIKNATNCDGDVLLVHSKTAEEKFVADGHGDFRRDLMFNDFVIIGPMDDPVGLLQAADLTDAMSRLAEGSSLFISRGDDSGTHKAERRLWGEAGIDTARLPITVYQEVGNGMGATINIAVETKAYTLTDRSTWTAFNNKRDAMIVFEGDPRLNNQYGIIPVSKSHCPYVKHEAALKFINWMLSDEGQAAIAGFKQNDTQLFFPNAK
jgi:tungstate transport system substrate-binding protein